MLKIVENIQRPYYVNVYKQYVLTAPQISQKKPFESTNVGH